MSCLMSSPELLAALANGLEISLNYDYSYKGFSVPSSVVDALSDCVSPWGSFRSEKIFEKLYRLNERAYARRYKEPDSIEIPSMPFIPVYLRAKYENERFIMNPDHYKLLKALDFFNYQISEDATAGDDLAKALAELAQVLAVAIVSNTEQYHLLRWGEV